MREKTYIAIDLKSFYASVECIERGLDPLTTNLVVADAAKTEKTICLAVTPSLKKLGLSGRSRLYDVVEKVRQENFNRKRKIYGKKFRASSIDENDLEKDDFLEFDYIAAPPRMAHYIDYSTRIYEVYLKYISEDDIHVYSIDEVFIDATNYLKARNKTALEFAKMIIKDVYDTTGITAAAGIGTNLYLAKIAMDIRAKHIEADEDGVRIAVLDEMEYRKYMWNHKPITDFWRVGKGYARRLEEIGLYTMGDVAKCSIGSENGYYNEDLLYKTFGINAELLIDHAWGYEPVEIKDIKSYKPENRSITAGQILPIPYRYKEALTVLKEMIDKLTLDLVKNKLVTRHLTIYIGYDIENMGEYSGNTTSDMYGRKLPKQTRGSINLDFTTSSSRHMIEKAELWYLEKVNKNLSIRRLNVSFDNIVDEKYEKIDYDFQLDFFNQDTDYKEKADIEKNRVKDFEKEKRLQQATVAIHKKFGKNALLKGINLEEEATAIDRNSMIGGHKA